MSNEAAVVAKYMDLFLLLIYALGQSECVTQPWYVRIDSNQFLILTRFTTIWKENYLILLPSYMLSPNLRWLAGLKLVQSEQ